MVDGGAAGYHRTLSRRWSHGSRSSQAVIYLAMIQLLLRRLVLLQASFALFMFGRLPQTRRPIRDGYGRW